MAFTVFPRLARLTRMQVPSGSKAIGIGLNVLTLNESRHIERIHGFHDLVSRTPAKPPLNAQDYPIWQTMEPSNTAKSFKRKGVSLELTIRAQQIWLNREANRRNINKVNRLSCRTHGPSKHPVNEAIFQHE